MRRATMVEPAVMQDFEEVLKFLDEAHEMVQNQDKPGGLDGINISNMEEIQQEINDKMVSHAEGLLLNDFSLKQLKQKLT